jgi:acyl carrier protein
MTRHGQEVLAALGTLWTLGQPVDLAALCGDGALIRLPGYPFAGRSWVAPEVTGRRPAAARPGPRQAPRQETREQAAAVTRSRDVRGTLADLWAELLGHRDLTDDSDFFGLGGDSLLITHLGRRIRQELGIRVPLKDLLTGRTLGRQAEIVRDIPARPAAV